MARVSLDHLDSATCLQGWAQAPENSSPGITRTLLFPGARRHLWEGQGVRVRGRRVGIHSGIEDPRISLIPISNPTSNRCSFLEGEKETYCLLTVQEVQRE